MNHPIHPMLVHFPIACWSLSSLADLASLFTIERVAWLAGVLMLAGLVLALPAMLAGMIDMSKIEASSRASNTVNQHMIFVMISWSLYALSLYARTDGIIINVPGYSAIGLSFLGFVSLGYAGWLGGRMVYEQGVGVNTEQ